MLGFSNILSLQITVNKVFFSYFSAEALPLKSLNLTHYKTTFVSLVIPLWKSMRLPGQLDGCLLLSCTYNGKAERLSLFDLSASLRSLPFCALWLFLFLIHHQIVKEDIGLGGGNNRHAVYRCKRTEGDCCNLPKASECKRKPRLLSCPC